MVGETESSEDLKSMQGRLQHPLVERPELETRWSVPPLSALFGTIAVVLQIILGRVLGILQWSHCYCGETAHAWGTNITVVTWYAACAVFFGAYAGRFFAGQRYHTRQHVRRAVLPAALGVAFSMPFVAFLATALTTDTRERPALSLGVSIFFGGVIGVSAAYIALRHTLVRMALWIHIGWIWFLGALSVVLSWSDTLPHTVPLGGVTLGQPPDDASAWERSASAITQSALTGFALVGPAVIAAGFAWWCMRRHEQLVVCWLLSLLGPILVFAVYTVRPSFLVGENHTWWGFSAKVLAVAAFVAASVLLFRRFSRSPNTESDPLISVKLRS